MELQHIVDTIDKSNPMQMDITGIAYEMGLPNGDEWDWSDNEFKQYWVRRHYCTDTHVGVTAMFLNDEFVGVTQQTGRKMDVEYQWVSTEAYRKVRDFVMSLCLPEEVEDDGIAIVDMSEEMGDGYHVSYGSQILDKEAIFEPTGEAVTFVRSFDRHTEVEKWRDVEVKFPNGEKRVINMSEYLIPYKLVVR